jgi:hypothetical protein
MGMTNNRTLVNQPNTQEIPRDLWNPFLTEFTRENRGAHARLEVLGSDTSYLVMTEDRPFDGVAADVKDGERIVWISFGRTAKDHLTHGVHSAALIRALLQSETAGAILEIEADDGNRTLLELSKPENYELPPPGR